MDLFDPRVTRAPATQAMASKALATSVNSAHLPDGARGNCPPTIALQAAEAEAVSGTHLYAFFQEVCPQLK